MRNYVARNKKESAELLVPQYSAGRVTTVVHAFLELWRVTIDVTTKFRYLAITENVAEERSEETLFLHHLKGWQPYSFGSVSIHFDQAKRYALEVKYKNGASPPVYDYVNTVSIGITLKY